MLAGLPIITEFLASNSNGSVDDNGGTSDWIEIYNAGDASVNLAGYTLTDDADNTDRWTFPSTNLAAGQFLVVRAETDAEPAQGSDLYTGFGLSAGGEYVGLYDPAGNVLSEFGAGGVDYPAQYTDVSYGVQFGGNFDQVSYFSTPTFGTANANPFAGVTSRVQADVGAGFYENSIQVSLSTSTQGATIRYTTDGSTPSASNGLVYSTPVTISSTSNLRAVSIRSGFLSVPDRTWSYIFVDDVLDQSTAGAVQAGFPQPGSLGSKVLDYGIDPQVIGIEGEQAVKDALLAIPSWSITTDIDNLFDPNAGIYANATRGGIDWERPASVELLNPDGSEGFQVNAGIRIRGGASRGNDNPKHSFRLFFRGEYGDSKLEYPVHGSAGTDTFDKIDLRTAQNYSWSKDGDDSNTFITDRLARLAQQALGQPSTNSTWLHLYVNGQYWGLYETQERSEADFGATYFGGDADDYDVIKPIGRNDPGAYTNFATDGNTDAYERLFQQALARDGNSEVPNFVNREAYLRAQGLNLDGTRNPNYEVLLDVDNLITYMTVIFSTTNRDAPISQFRRNEQLNNYYAMRDRTGDDGFRFFIHDSEHGMRDLNRDRTGPYNHENFESGVEFFNPQWLHQQLMANDEYRIAFADKIYESHFNDGVMTPENQLARLEAVAVEIDQAIIGESARWGDAKETNPLLRQDWLDAVDGVRNFINNRNPLFLGQLRDTTLVLKDSSGDYTVEVDAPLFPSVDAPNYLVDGTFQHGGEITAGSSLSFAASNTVYYTTDGSDPRDVGGGINQNATSFNTGVTTTSVFGLGETWSYEESGNNLGTAWRSSSFNDSSWDSGNGDFGYGNGGQGTLIDFGINGNDKHITTYFRKTFNVPAGSIVGATLNLIRDDGAVVYLNGVEIGRSNMPSGTIEFDTEASSAVSNANEYTPHPISIDPDLLLSGSNTLAIEVHQASPGSSDLVFDAELEVSMQSSSAQSVILNNSTNVKSRTFTGGQWSALSNVTFVLPGSQNQVRISEINYNPADATAAENAAAIAAGIAGGIDDNDDFEFLEFYNPSATDTINLNGFQLSDGVTFNFPNENLAPGERAVVVRNSTAFAIRYGDDIRILGEWSGGLNNGGEDVELTDGDQNVIMSVNYGDNDPWYNATDGHGFSLVLDQPSVTPEAELGKYYSWRASTELGGTPGFASAQPLGVVVNEVLAHTDAPRSDSIELFNPTASAINISGWYLSDEGDDLLKFQIPAGTVLAAGGYAVFTEQDFNPNPTNPAVNHFALSGSSGDQVYLSQATSGNFVSLQDAVEFDATFNGDSLGRLPNGTGRLTRLANNSFGSANGVAAVSPLVISEVNYHPADPTASALAIDSTLTADDLEFIEVANTSGATIDLRNWRLRGEADFDFLAGSSLASGESVVVVSFDPNDSAKLSAFRANYGLTSTVTIVGGFTGGLSNSSGRIALQQPDIPDMADIPRVVVDEVVYDDLAPWADADGSGFSLTRNSALVNGNFASSWIASSPTPGDSDLVSASPPQVTNTIRDGGGVLARPDLLTTFSVTFDQGVNVSASDLLVGDETLGALVDTSGIGFAYDASTLTATWSFSSMPKMEASYYTFGLSNSITGTSGGGSLDGDGDGDVGGGYFEQVYVAIPGDANLDGDVEVNDINIFLGTNTGDGATVLSNLEGSGTYNWSQGDFNNDGDVDSSQLNIFTGVQSGDYAVFLANLGRNVRPGSSQSVTSQPVVSQPVASQPIVSQSVAVVSVALPVSSSAKKSFSVAESNDASTLVAPIAAVARIAPVAAVELTSFFTDALTSVVPVGELELLGAQANVDVLNDDIRVLASSTSANATLVVAEDSSLELEGAHQLLDGFFSEDIGDGQYDAGSNSDDAEVDSFSEAWDWPSFT